MSTLYRHLHATHRIDLGHGFMFCCRMSHLCLLTPSHHNALDPTSDYSFDHSAQPLFSQNFFERLDEMTDPVAIGRSVRHRLPLFQRLFMRPCNFIISLILTRFFSTRCWMIERTSSQSVCRLIAQMHSLDLDGNFFRYQRRILWFMLLVAEQQLQGMGARRQIQYGSRLALIEVQMACIAWNRRIHVR